MSAESDRTGRNPSVAPASRRPDVDDARIRTRGRLPHFECDEATYFVTFRLFDSLPREVTERLKEPDPRRRNTRERSTPTSIVAPERPGSKTPGSRPSCWMRFAISTATAIG